MSVCRAGVTQGKQDEGALREDTSRVGVPANRPERHPTWQEEGRLFADDGVPRVANPPGVTRGLFQQARPGRSPTQRRRGGPAAFPALVANSRKGSCKINFLFDNIKKNEILGVRPQICTAERNYGRREYVPSSRTGKCPWSLEGPPVAEKIDGGEGAGPGADR